jgi:hypothetical protein
MRAQIRLWADCAVVPVQRGGGRGALNQNDIVVSTNP